MTTQQKCICLTEQPQGTRPGPNAEIRLTAEPKCQWCGGSGLLAVTISHDPPPVPIYDADWNATVDGCEEYSPVGYGITGDAALLDLMNRLSE